MSGITTSTARRIVNGSTLPATCRPGQVFVVPSTGMYVCFTADAWTLLDSSASGEVTGSGTTSALPKWTNGAGSVVGDSLLSDNATTLSYNAGKFTVTATNGNVVSQGSITTGATGVATGSLLFKGTTSGTVTVKSADAAGTWSLTLPANDGDAGQYLQTDGAGVSSWQTVTAGIGGSTGATDNAILRADGAGGATVQNSAVTISDAGAITSSNSADATLSWLIKNNNTGSNAEANLEIEANGGSIKLGHYSNAHAAYGALGSGDGFLYKGGNIAIMADSGGVIKFASGGATERWRMDGSGHFIAGADNSYDIGASGATRPRTGYFGTSVVSPLFTGALNGTVGATTPAAASVTTLDVRPTSGNALAFTAGSVATASTFKAGDKGFGAGGQIQLLDGATPTVEETSTNGINLGSALRVFWSSAAGIVGADDAGLSRVGVNTIGVGTGAAGSTAGHLSLTNLAASGNINGLIFKGGTPGIAGNGTLNTNSKDSAGKITTTATGASTVVLTFSSAFANAPACTATNETTANLMRATSTTTTLTLSGTIVSGDVISYQCIGY